VTSNTPPPVSYSTFTTTISGVPSAYTVASNDPGSSVKNGGDSSASPLSIAAIAGICVGAALAVAMVILAACCYGRRKRNARSKPSPKLSKISERPSDEFASGAIASTTQPFREPKLPQVQEIWKPKAPKVYEPYRPSSQTNLQEDGTNVHRALGIKKSPMIKNDAPRVPEIDGTDVDRLPEMDGATTRKIPEMDGTERHVKANQPHEMDAAEGKKAPEGKVLHEADNGHEIYELSGVTSRPH
jgi:hypothetical protein